MRTILLSICLFLSIITFGQKQITLSELKAFPSSEGYGKNTTGGNTGTIYHVTNLNSSGEGSLRDAIRNHTEPRSIVFDVSGYIDITVPIKVRKDHGFVSILGQTSPKGVCLRGAGLFVHDEEVIIRHIKAAPGRDGYLPPDSGPRGSEDYEPADAMQIVAFSNQSIQNVVLDHVTAKWGADGLLDLGPKTGSFLKNISISNSLFYENIDKHYGNLFSSNPSTTENISYYRNALLGVNDRALLVQINGIDKKLEVINNIFTFKRGANSIFWGLNADFIGNSWNHFGPDRVTGTIRFTSSKPKDNIGNIEDTRLFISDNTDSGSPSTVSSSTAPYVVNNRIGDSGVSIISESEVKSTLFSSVGTMFRDQSDINAINKAINEVEIVLINHEDEVGGYPILSTEKRPTNFDSIIDGISNEFVAEHNLTGDGLNITTNWNFETYTLVNNAGYSDREIYWAWLANDFDSLEGKDITSDIFINENLAEVTPYASQDITGEYQITNSNQALNLKGNTWKKVLLDYEITPNTLLEFDFRVDGEGELQGIGLDDNGSFDVDVTPEQLYFKLYGTQDVDWDNNDFENYTEIKGWKSYSIPVGKYAINNSNYLVFIGDKDISPLSQDCSFRNIRFREKALNEEEIWLEAECAIVGQGWSTVQDTSASGGAYLLPPSGVNYNTPPTSSSDIVTFDFEIDSGEYGIYARVNTPNQEDDSFWVRTNSGDWTKWNELSNSDGFKWNGLYDSDNQDAIVTFNLLDGNNTIDFARREDGAALDKILIKAVGATPSGLGTAATNCAPVIPQTISLAPTNDAYLRNSDRFDLDIIRVSPNARVAYLNYDLTGITGNITNAELQFTVTQDTGSGDIKVYKGSNTNWTENNLSINNRPIEGSILATILDVGSSGSKSVELNASLLNSRQSLNLIIKQSSGDDFTFASKEDGNLGAPTLDITYQNSSGLNTISAKTKLKANQSIIVYPNPTTNIVTIEGLTGRSNITISDVFGRILKILVTNDAVANLILSGFAPGNYFIKIIDNSSDETFIVLRK